MITKTAYNLVCSETAKRLKQKKKKARGIAANKKRINFEPDSHNESNNGYQPDQ
jgi:hypothetical protein